MTDLAIDTPAIANARKRIGKLVTTTPVLTNAVLNTRAGGRVFIKAESLQRTGSFKFRGAINRLLCLSPDEQRRGVIAFSSGNHALAIAESARVLGCTAVLVMPSDAPDVKISGTRARGAEVILYDRRRDDRERITAALIDRRGLILVPPFDDPFVMAGQGTAAAEALEQLAVDHEVNQIDQALICCSGGGLAAGWTIALKAASARTSIVVVEPQGFDDTTRSLASSRWERNTEAAGTICDSLQVGTPGRLTLPILLANQARGVTVSDDDVRAAIYFAATELKLVLEPGGAAPLAALLSGRVDGRDKRTLIIASGGNIDPDLLKSILDAKG